MQKVLLGQDGVARNRQDPTHKKPGQLQEQTVTASLPHVTRVVHPQQRGIDLLP